MIRVFMFQRKSYARYENRVRDGSFRLRDEREIVCEMGRSLSRAKLSLDFSAFLSIAILHSERLERRI